MSIKRTGSLSQALNRLVASKEQHVTCGIQSGSFDEHGKSNAVKAFLNEYGTKTIPPRPAMRDTVKTFRGEWVAIFKDCIAAGKPLDFTFQLVGQKMATDMTLTYTTFNSPANAESTARKKGFNKPLDDTGSMINSIDFEVVEGKL